MGRGKRRRGVVHSHMLDKQACRTGACCAKQAGGDLLTCSLAEYMAARV